MSRFVSGGTIPGDDPPSISPPPQAPGASKPTPPASAKNAEWEAVQRNLEAERRRREELRRANGESTGAEKSLYEVLQANKEAKQAAFEEANKIRNQFRALDDYEVDFLDGIVADERREEERRRRETEEGLREFREAQKKAGVAPVEVDDEKDGLEGVGAEEWVAAAGGARKRKREKEGIIKGLKRRVSEGDKQSSATYGKTHQTTSTKAEIPSTKTGSDNVEEAERTPAKVESASKIGAQRPKMGLVDYGSDEDDDD